MLPGAGLIGGGPAGSKSYQQYPVSDDPRMNGLMALND
jgi:hypothetical protein